MMASLTVTRHLNKCTKERYLFILILMSKQQHMILPLFRWKEGQASHPCLWTKYRIHHFWHQERNCGQQVIYLEEIWYNWRFILSISSHISYSSFYDIIGTTVKKGLGIQDLMVRTQTNSSVWSSNIWISNSATLVTRHWPLTWSVQYQTARLMVLVAVILADLSMIQLTTWLLVQTAGGNHHVGVPLQMYSLELENRWVNSQ